MSNNPSKAVRHGHPPGLSGSYPSLFFLILATAGLAWSATKLASFGYVFLVGIPVGVGFMVGYYAYTSLVLIPVTVSIVLVSVLGIALMQSWAGIYCGAMALVAIVLPATVGGIIGHFVRRRDLGRARADLGAVLIFLMPLGLWAEAKITPPHALETIVTTRVVSLSPAEAWSAAAFYEDVPLKRSRLLGIGLPTPIGTTGRQDEVGAIVQCLYENASLTKRMTEVVPGKVLAFEVVQQQGIEDRSAALRNGAFHFEELQDGRTLVTLQSTYEPLLDARTLWRPFELLLCRSLHQHILDGLEAQEPEAVGDGPARDARPTQSVIASRHLQERHPNRAREVRRPHRIRVAVPQLEVPGFPGPH